MLRIPIDSKGIILLKLGGVVYRAPWSSGVMFQNNDPDAFLGFEMFENYKYDNHQSIRIIFKGEEAYIMEWDIGEFFERPKLPEQNVDN